MIGKAKITRSRLFLYVVLIGYLFPRGPREISGFYHKLCALLIWASVALTWVQQIRHWRRPRIRKTGVLISGYFVLSILITLAVRGSLSSGLQQMLAAPSLCVFLIYNMKRSGRQLLGAMNAIFGVVFTLDLLLTPGRRYLGGVYHVVFLGHIQAVSQIGLAALFVAALYWMLYHEGKRRVLYTAAVALVTMLLTDAASAVVSAAVILVTYAAYRCRSTRFLCLPSEIYIFGMVLLSVAVIYLAAVNTSILPGFEIHGRRFVWQSAIERFQESPLLGYGIDGVYLQTFWSNNPGFNYAHNQVMQNLIDGGLVLFAAFWAMILGFSSAVRNIKGERLVALCNVSLILLLFIMLFDSTTLYVYMYICLALIYAIPEAQRERAGEKRIEYGRTQ